MCDTCDRECNARVLGDAEYRFGTTRVAIIQGDILQPKGAEHVQVVVSSDDNYLTMAGGVAKLLRTNAGDADNGRSYRREALECCRQQAEPGEGSDISSTRCHLKAGAVARTRPYGLTERLENVEWVLHGAVVDLDTEDHELEDLVAMTTTNCLQTAETLRTKDNQPVESILFPAFATGLGGLDLATCARKMCGAIKAFLAQERNLKEIYILLHRKGDGQGSGAAEGDGQDLEAAEAGEQANQRFIDEARLVLGVPYDPGQRIRQIRDFYGREPELDHLAQVLTHQIEGKRHAAILGGPAIGKWTLLDQLYYRAHLPGHELSVALQNAGQRLVKMPFGRVQKNTPLSFVYQKFLCAMADEGLLEAGEIQDYLADPDLNCDTFLEVVRRLVGKGEPNLQEIVFLVDHIPLLMEMEARDSERQGFVQEFWQDLDELQRGVRFVFTARNDEFRVLRKRRLENRATDFLESLEIIGLGSIDGRQRRCWVCALFKDYYPDYAQEPLEDFYSFFEEQAGGHPTLMSLAGHALIKALRVVTDEEDHRGEAMRLARQTLDAPRRELFNYLLKAIDRQQARDLQTLAQAVAIEDELALLVRDLRDGDPNALRRWEELLGEVNPREYLHQETLRELEDDGYVVRVNGGSPDKGAPAQPQFEERLLSSRWSEFRTSRYQAEVDDYQKKWQFTARPLAQYVQEYFRASRGNGSGQEPKDVVISLFGGERALNGEGPADRPLESDGSLIWTTLHTRGARVISAQKPFPLSMRQEFLAGFGTLLDQLLHPTSQGGEDRGGPFRNLEEVGSLILSQFTTVDIKRHLQELPIGSTVLLMMDESLKEIPWELMLEPAYAGEIPFRVGRVVVSPEQPQFLEPRGRAGKVKALLIGNPGGDLKFAETEVKWLRKRLERDGRFAQPDVLIGPEECRRIPLLNRLASGEYGLIHYSGHTFYDGERSAWLLSRDGQDNGDNLIRTEQLTSALQMGPPAIVFSSSCESAATGEEGADAGGGLGRMRYENQTFDLPSAFLQAGVEAYIGTLWEVGDGAALDFVQDFYTAFLNATCDLGECLRRAKSAQKQRSGFRDRIMWLSFILYGDPHIAPGDLFPILRSLAAPA